jgi:hypothetical protein
MLAHETHAKAMTNDQMINDEKSGRSVAEKIGHSSFVIPSSFDIRASSF